MNKKIVSFLLAFSTLATSAGATNLKDFINGNADLQPKQTVTAVLTNGIFDVSAAPINTTATATVSKNGGAYGTEVTSTAVTDRFDFKVGLDMTAVKTAFKKLYSSAVNTIDNATLKNGSSANLADLKSAAKTQFDKSNLWGEFTVTVTYDSRFAFDTNNIVFSQDGQTVPAIFNIKSIGTPTVINNLTSKIDVVIEVDTVNVPTVGGLNAKIDAADSQLNNLYVTLSSVGLAGTLTRGDALTTTAQLTNGYVEVTDATSSATNEVYGKVSFLSDPAVAKVTYSPASISNNTSSSSGGGYRPSITPSAAPNVTISAGGTTTTAGVYMNSGKYFLNVDGISAPAKENFAFEGWYTDPYFSNEIKGTVQVSEDLTLYARYINLKAPEQFVSDVHIAYISGYPDGTVQPNGNITREEVVAALYRLLKPEFRAKYETTENNFADVEADRWSVAAISTMANAGYLVGDENDNFNPSNPITRAEFVALVTRFLGDVEVPETNQFSDISGHWAEKAILTAANGAYWISGYEDGTFRPNNYITRAEAITIINKMLVRYGDANAAHADTWSDVSEHDWFYTQIIEATTTTDYERLSNGWQEKWTSESDKTDDEVTVVPEEDQNAEEETEEVTDVTEITDETEGEEETDGTEEVLEEDGEQSEVVEDEIDETEEVSEDDEK